MSNPALDTIPPASPFLLNGGDSGTLDTADAARASTSPEEMHQLLGCLRDLIALSALPATDPGAGPRDIAERLAEVFLQCQRAQEELAQSRAREEALRHSELKFRRLLEKLPAGAYTCDPEGLITYFNPQAEQLWGRSPKLNDPVDRFCGSFKLFAADGAPISHDQCWMALALKTQSEFCGQEIVVERPDGTRLAALAYATPIHDQSGVLLGAVNILVDITPKKRAEEALQEADRRKDEFLATLAHELRNPLAPIRNALHILRMSGSPGPPAERVLEMMDRQVNHMVRLVDDLLEVSRITRGKIELRKERVDLSAVVRSA
ncbi:MAG: PAS domain S-box protein, partial [Gemmataceae bacterium]|nr:PAS domain S-box protein [Gemmataceae bacterium]